MANAKDQVIQTTCDLLEAQGYHATGLNQIIKESGSPKGSLYYYFPEGKEELVIEAIARTGLVLADRIEQGLSAHSDPAEAVSHLMNTIAGHIESAGFKAGGPLTMVAMETAASSERINQSCRGAYLRLQGAFQRKLETSGLTNSRAKELAEYITAVIEGATILSRTFHSGDPLRRAADEVRNLLQKEAK